MVIENQDPAGSRDRNVRAWQFSETVVHENGSHGRSFFFLRCYWNPDVRAAAEQLVHFHERFAPLFGKEQAQDHAYDYLKGLLVCPERESIEPIALLVGHGDVSGLQKFIGAGPWPYDEVQAEAQSLFVDELVPSAANSPVGVVGVVDESAFTKKGTHSAGVARQHNGRLGKEDNCQVGVFLIGVTPAGSALLDHRLFLPED